MRNIAFVLESDELISMDYGGGGPIATRNIAEGLAHFYRIIYLPSPLSLYKIWNQLGETEFTRRVIKLEDKGIILPPFLRNMEKSGYGEVELLQKIPSCVLGKYFEEAKNADILFNSNFYLPGNDNIESSITFRLGAEIRKPLVLYVHGLGDLRPEFLHYIKILLKEYGIQFPLTSLVRYRPTSIQPGLAPSLSCSEFAMKVRKLLTYFSQFKKTESVWRVLSKSNVDVTVVSDTAGSIDNLRVRRFNLPTRQIEPSSFDTHLLDFAGTQKKDNVVFFARISPFKGVVEAIRAFSILLGEFPGLKLSIVGKVSGFKIQERILQVIRQKGLSEHVTLLGFLSDDELYKIVSSAKVTIYPTHADAMSRVILESLALGTPVVTYGIPGVKFAYSEIDQVKLVKEFDVTELANGVASLLKLNDEEYHAFMHDHKLHTFLRERETWNRTLTNLVNLIDEKMERSNFTGSITGLPKP